MTTRGFSALALALATLAGSPAIAQVRADATQPAAIADSASPDQAPGSAPEAAPEATPASVIAATADPFGAGAALAEDALGKVTGREDIGQLIASATQRNTVSNNSVTGNSVTGAVQIDGNAFQNLQGLAVINANSGNNVAINSAMNVTINMAPPR